MVAEPILREKSKKDNDSSICFIRSKATNSPSICIMNFLSQLSQALVMTLS